jgi:hypothetical protein
LSIAAIDVDQAVVPVGVEPNGQMEIPERPTVVGWWRAGARVGSEDGTIVLAGHLDSRRYGVGPLKRLTSLERGDRAVLRTDDRKRATYVVESVTTLTKKRLPTEQLFDQSGPRRLVLVTCGGTYRPSQGGWDSNVVVVLRPAR